MIAVDDLPACCAIHQDGATKWCETHWWAEQRAAHAAGEPVHLLAVAVVSRDRVTPPE